MAEKKDVPLMGRVVNGGTRTGGTVAVRDDILPTPYNECQSADINVQSPALLLPASCGKRAFHPLVAHSVCIVCFVHDWQFLPALCRGHAHCGIMFAA